MELKRGGAEDHTTGNPALAAQNLAFGEGWAGDLKGGGEATVLVKRDFECREVQKRLALRILRFVDAFFDGKQVLGGNAAGVFRLGF